MSCHPTRAAVALLSLFALTAGGLGGAAAKPSASSAPRGEKIDTRPEPAPEVYRPDAKSEGERVTRPDGADTEPAQPVIPPAVTRGVRVMPGVGEVGMTMPGVVDGTESDDRVGPTARITTANARPIERFADVLAVHRGGASHCTAVLIEPTVAITAAHCLPADHVTIGPVASRPRGARRVVEMARAPEGLDAALLRLDLPVVIARRALRRAHDTTPPSGEGMLVGFGAIDSGGRQGAGLRRFGTVWFDGWGCDRLRRTATGCRPGDELVIAGVGGSDTCDGDSGGPVFERTARGWRLLALTSRPLRNARRRCGDGGIYVRVDRLAPWLDTMRARWKPDEPSKLARPESSAPSEDMP